jgi:hypothetical protein
MYNRRPKKQMHEAETCATKSVQSGAIHYLSKCLAYIHDLQHRPLGSNQQATSRELNIRGMRV